jgi:repressor LexA
MAKFGTILKKLRVSKGLGQKEVGAVIGVSDSSIRKYESDDRTPTPDAIKKLSVFFGVTTDYLLGNSDLMYSNEVHLPSENKKVPIIGTVRCGPNGLAYEYVDGYIYVDSSLTGDIRAFHCKGDSMTGLGIFDGDIAVVRIQADVESGELAVVVINGDEGTLKRVRKHDGVLVLEAANAVYPPRVFTGKELNTVKIVGKVIEVRKTF